MVEVIDCQTLYDNLVKQKAIIEDLDALYGMISKIDASKYESKRKNVLKAITTIDCIKHKIENLMKNEK